MNFWNILISALILAVLAGAVALTARRKKNGGCCGDCGSCGDGSCCGDRAKK